MCASSIWKEIIHSVFARMCSLCQCVIFNVRERERERKREREKERERERGGGGGGGGGGWGAITCMRLDTDYI